MNLCATLSEQAKIVVLLDPAVPSTTTPDYVSMKGYPRCTIIVLAKNATTVTGSAITVKQATAVAGTGEKAVAFTTAGVNIDTGATDTLVQTAVSNNTFTTDNTNSKNGMYVIEIREDDLDVANGFDCIRVGTGDATAATITAIAILWPAKYSRTTPPAAITN